MKFHMTQRMVDLTRLMQERFEAGLRETTTWFRAEMPPYYFQVTALNEQLRHLEVLHWMRSMGDFRLTMVDDVEAGKLICFGKPGPDLLTNAVDLLGNRDFHRLEFHASRDGTAAMVGFAYGEDQIPKNFDMSAMRQNVADACCHDDSCIARHVVDRYLEAVGGGYLARSYPKRVARHIGAWANHHDPQGVEVSWDTVESTEGTQTRFMVTSAMRRRDYITNLSRFLSRSGLLCVRSYLDLVPALVGDDELLISSVYLTDEHQQALTPVRATQIATGLRGLRRAFASRLGELASRTTYPEHHFALLVAGFDFIAQILAEDHPFLDVREVGGALMESHQDLCATITGLVDDRFGPRPSSIEEWDGRFADILEQINADGDPATMTVLDALLRFVGSIRLTNIFRAERLGQAFLLGPEVLPSSQFPREPYAIIYVHGTPGSGFQVRFRASARGGLRVLIPRTAIQHGRSQDKLLREVYDLAWAQQLKNKDIPEGGSKCIGLVRHGGDPDDLVHMLTDGILDLAVPAVQVPDIRGPHGSGREDDLIFLGPDENMTPERIAWVADRAVFRGLAHALTFMSSKPGAGINHKEYGVTSEGIYTWIPHALRAVGIHEDKPWTLKMTGGPDGDVGGNLINILYREQPDRCRILSVSDGTGSAYDPDGLDWDELLRLFHEGRGIADFDAAKIRGAGGHAKAVTDKDSEQLRNDLHNMVVADVFVPCGGRPYTINERNWERFLQEDGSPSAKVMVEGANIFVTAPARDALQDAGVVVVKDSSANKGGVICSSYEILAGLITSEGEFTEIKDVYVEQTVAKLRHYAEEEAEALLEAWRRRRRQERLSDLSMTFSAEINRISGLLIPQIAARLEDADHVATWRAELEDHCPAILVERYGDRLEDRIPRDHRIALLAKHYASRMLYREGLTWCTTYVTDDDIDDVFTAYLEADQEIRKIEQSLCDDAVASRPDIIDALTIGARRELVRKRLGL